MKPQVNALPPAPEVSEADRERARRYVASSATDAADASLLLQMLGLLGPESVCPGRKNWYGKGVCRCVNCTRAWAEAARLRRAAAKRGAA